MSQVWYIWIRLRESTHKRGHAVVRVLARVGLPRDRPRSPACSTYLNPNSRRRHSNWLRLGRANYNTTPTSRPWAVGVRPRVLPTYGGGGGGALQALRALLPILVWLRPAAR